MQESLTPYSNYYELALQEYLGGEYTRCLDYLSDIKEKDEKKDIDRILLCALCKAHLGEFDKAIEICKEAKGLMPQYYEVYRVRSDICFMMGDYFQSVKDFDTAVLLSPSGLVAFAETFSIEKIQEKLNGLENYRESSEYCFNKGLLNALANNFTDSIKYFEEAKKNNRTNYVVEYSLGAIKFTNGDEEGALENLTRCISLHSEYSPAYELRGCIRYSRDELKASIEDFQLACKHNKNNFNALYYIGLAKIRLSKNGTYPIELYKAFKANPANRMILKGNNLYKNTWLFYTALYKKKEFDVLSNHSRLSQAAVILKGFLKIEPDNLKANLMMADMYVTFPIYNRSVKALSYLHKTRNLFEAKDLLSEKEQWDYERTLKNIASCEWWNRNYQEAVRYAEYALTLRPDPINKGALDFYKGYIEKHNSAE